MTKHVGPGMLVGLALVAGCSPMPHDRAIASRAWPGSGQALPPVPAVEQAAKGQAARVWAGDAVPPPPLPPPPAEQKSPSTVPEAVEVRVAAGRAPEAAPPSGFPAAAGRTPAWGSPEVVLLGVDPGTGQGVVQASVPTEKGTAEAAQVIPADLRSPKAGGAPPPDGPPAPGYGHAPDFSWLTGELQHLLSRNVWRLRYAPADQEDRYGGTVLLVGDELPAECRPGQIVRVEGELVNPESDEPRPPYRVRKVQILKAAPPSEE